MQDFIKAQRKRLGLSQAELAEILGVAVSAVGMWESGERRPRHETIPTLARVLRCTIDDLYGGSQESGTASENSPNNEPEGG